MSEEHVYSILDYFKFLDRTAVKDLSINTTANLSKAWVPYVTPMAIYMAFLAMESQWQETVTLLYPIKTLAVGAALVWFRNEYVELRPPRHVWGNPGFLNYWLAVAIGLAAIIIWIGADRLYPGLTELMGGTSTTRFDPTTIRSPGWRYTFLGFRVFGAVAVVAFMEEIFWRGFLIRWIDDRNFKRVPIGTFSWISFGVTVALFAFEHEEWLAGVACGALYNWLYYKRKSLFCCVLAHATSNAALSVWILWQRDWKFW